MDPAVVIPAKAGIHRTVAVEQTLKTERYPLTVTPARLIRPVRVYATNNTFAFMVAQYLRAILGSLGVCSLSKSTRCIQPEKQRIKRGHRTSVPSLKLACIGGECAMPLEQFLESLTGDSTDLSQSDFIEVSNLMPEELGQFVRTWFTIPVERKRWTISTMVELTEDNPELDFSAVFKLCLKEQDEEVLENAMEGLWEHEDRSVINGLINVLHSSNSPRVRAAAAVALGKFPVLVQEGKILAKDGDAILNSLMKVLDDPDQPVEVVRRSLEAVAPFNTERIRDLVDKSYKSDDLQLKSSSIFAMGRTGDASWLPLLIKELQSPEPGIRYETAHACAELAEDEAVPHLIALLEDDDYQVQLAGISALGKIGGPLAKKVLVNCVKEGDAALEEAARVELENIDFMDDPLGFTSDI